jgi:hypothetical protein
MGFTVIGEQSNPRKSLPIYVTIAHFKSYLSSKDKKNIYNQKERALILKPQKLITAMLTMQHY